MVKYRFLEHTADIKFQAFGKSLEEVFKNSALALKEIISKDKIKPVKKKKISVLGEDNENLLLNFLEEFLFLFETEGFLLSKINKIKIKKDRKEIEAELIGDTKKYELGNHVKAITYNQMYVKKQGNKYICQVVVDV